MRCDDVPVAACNSSRALSHTDIWLHRAVHNGARRALSAPPARKAVDGVDTALRVDVEIAPLIALVERKQLSDRPLSRVSADAMRHRQQTAFRPLRRR